VSRRRSLALAALLLLIGCSDSSESSLPVAGVAELSGPYLSEPFRAFDQALLQKAEDECATMNSDASLELVLADGRGGGRILLVYDGSNGASAECVATVEANGSVLADGAGTSSGGQDLPGPREIRPMSGGSSCGPGAWSYLHGRVGSEISRVILELADGSHVTASLSNGRFAAWWPGDQSEARFLGYDAAGNQIAN
jgi:hypothetical protein